jgi:hypothetical protein
MMRWLVDMVWSSGHGDGLDRYCNHTSGNPWLLLSVLNADFVKGTARMSYSFGACTVIH